MNLLRIDGEIPKFNLEILESLNGQIDNADIQIAKDAVNEDQVMLLLRVCPASTTMQP